ncbi:Holliday junction resolvase RuvX [Candidatus Poribacteria bacterium]|nr:MAG: Holliday junction resolvase RuvX [Candidatus Poribacteria bacterium]
MTLIFWRFFLTTHHFSCKILKVGFLRFAVSLCCSQNDLKIEIEETIMAILLGLDIGDTRIGVAISDALGVAAHPLCTLTRKNRQVDLIVISDLVSIHEVECVVIGLPISLDGSLGTQAETVQKFAKRLESVLDVPIAFQDERFTTAEAEEILRELGKDAREQKGIIDEVAAVLILRDYMNRCQETASPASVENV